MIYFDLVIIILFFLNILWVILSFNKDSALGCLVLFIIFGIAGILPEGKNENIPIVSLEKSMSINGGFVLGFGTIESEMKYFAYQSLGGDRYNLVTLPNVTLEETDSKKPAYVKTVTCQRPLLFSYCKTDEVIYIPKGTIKKSFNP